MKLFIYLSIFLSYALFPGDLIAKNTDNRSYDPSSYLKDRTRVKSRSLREGWEFYPGLDFKEAMEKRSNNPVKIIKTVPYTWRSINEDGKLKSSSHATFIKEIDLRIFNSDIKTGIKLEGIFTNYNLYQDAKLIGSAGRFGKSRNQSRPEVRTRIFSIENKGQKTLIALEIGNLFHPVSGIRRAPVIGEKSYLSDQYQFNTLLKTLLIGSIIMTGIFCICFFLLRKQMVSVLYFGFFAIFSGIYSLMPNEAYLFFIDEKYRWVMTYKITFLCFYLSPIFFIHFIHRVFRFDTNDNAMLILNLAGALLVISVIFLDPYRFIQIIDFYKFFVAFTGLYSVYLCFKAAKNKRIGAKTLLTSLVFGFAMVVNDILNSYELIETGYFTHIGIFVFVMLQTLYLWVKYSKHQKSNENLTAMLKKEVRRQTEKLSRAANEALSARTQIEEQNEELKIKDQQKTHFFQNISHEIRTPLMLIISPLQEAILGRDTEYHLSVALKNSKRLLRLMNQLLDFQKIKAGKLELKREKIDTVRFIYACADYFGPASHKKGLKFKILVDERSILLSFEKDLKYFIYADPDALEKIAFNFLSNAIKFNKAGGEIVLGIKNFSGKTRIFVKDSGPGISKEDQEKLFSEFPQIDNVSEQVGSGLGLAYVKELSNHMGAVVGLDSKPGEGSTFWIDFDSITDDDEETAETQFDGFEEILTDEITAERMITEITKIESLREQSFSKQKILLIDDNQDLLNLLSGYLKDDLYIVYKARNAIEAINVLDQRNPDLIICDLMMPEIDGTDFVMDIRNNPNYSATPIIIISAKSDEETRFKASEIGANGFLTKPFGYKEMSNAVKNLLNLKNREKEMEKLNRHLSENVLKRYLPPSLVEKILSGEVSIDASTQAKVITVMFTDLTGFTSLSSELGPQKIAEMLNLYLSEMTEFIHDHGGTIDKFIGDGIMILFGAPQQMDEKSQAKNALNCARDMLHGINQLNQNWASYGLPPLNMRIGIHQGKAIVGNFGGIKRADFTAIGPTVNLASRIESAAGNGEIFLSREVRKHLREENIVSAGKFSLKGIKDDVELFKDIATYN